GFYRYVVAPVPFLLTPANRRAMLPVRTGASIQQGPWYRRSVVRFQYYKEITLYREHLRVCSKCLRGKERPPECVTGVHNYYPAMSRSFTRDILPHEVSYDIS